MCKTDVFKVGRGGDRFGTPAWRHVPQTCDMGLQWIAIIGRDQHGHGFDIGCGNIARGPKNRAIAGAIGIAAVQHVADDGIGFHRIVMGHADAGSVPHIEPGKNHVCSMIRFHSQVRCSP